MKEQTINTGINLLDSLSHGGPFSLAIVGLLVCFSLVSWSVIIERWIALSLLVKNSEVFLEVFWVSKNLSDLSQKAKLFSHSPLKEVFFMGYNEMIRVMQVRDKKGITASTPLSFDTVQRSLQKARYQEEGVMAKRLNILAICASACPFIGLLGTVMGIIKAFQDISLSGSSSLASVAPGISEALLATALGLVAAIPSAIFYNIFLNKAKFLLLKVDGFSIDFLNILQRHFSNLKESSSFDSAENKI